MAVGVSFVVVYERKVVPRGYSLGRCMRLTEEKAEKVLFRVPCLV